MRQHHLDALVVIRKRFTFAGETCRVTYEYPKQIHVVYLTVEFLEQVEFSYYHECPNATRPETIRMAERLAAEIEFDIDLVFPGQKPIRIMKNV